MNRKAGYIALVAAALIAASYTIAPAAFTKWGASWDSYTTVAQQGARAFERVGFKTAYVGEILGGDRYTESTLSVTDDFRFQKGPTAIGDFVGWHDLHHTGITKMGGFTYVTNNSVPVAGNISIQSGIAYVRPIDEENKIKLKSIMAYGKPFNVELSSSISRKCTINSGLSEINNVLSVHLANCTSVGALVNNHAATIEVPNNIPARAEFDAIAFTGDWDDLTVDLRVAMLDGYQFPVTVSRVFQETVMNTLTDNEALTSTDNTPWNGTVDRLVVDKDDQGWYIDQLVPGDVFVAIVGTKVLVGGIRAVRDVTNDATTRELGYIVMYSSGLDQYRDIGAGAGVIRFSRTVPVKKVAFTGQYGDLIDYPIADHKISVVDGDVQTINDAEIGLLVGNSAWDGDDNTRTITSVIIADKAAPFGTDVSSPDVDISVLGSVDNRPFMDRVVGAEVSLIVSLTRYGRADSSLVIRANRVQEISGGYRLTLLSMDGPETFPSAALPWNATLSITHPNTYTGIAGDPRFNVYDAAPYDCTANTVGHQWLMSGVNGQPRYCKKTGASTFAWTIF